MTLFAVAESKSKLGNQSREATQFCRAEPEVGEPMNGT
jgi:hypothetical protein